MVLLELIGVALGASLINGMTKKSSMKANPQLDVKQFAINVTTGANGSTSTSNAMVNYGEDAPNIVINFPAESLSLI